MDWAMLDPARVPSWVAADGETFNPLVCLGETCFLGFFDSVMGSTYDFPLCLSMMVVGLLASFFFPSAGFGFSESLSRVEYSELGVPSVDCAVG